MVDTISCRFVQGPFGRPRTDMLVGVVRHMAPPNQIIVNEAQGSRKPLLFMDQPTIKLGLDPIMSPAFLTEGCQLQQRRNLHMKHGKVRPTHT